MSSASELEKKARNCSKSFLSFILGNKLDESQDLFNQAANQYKQLHQWKDAARCYVEASKIAEKQNDMIFAALNLTEASTSLLKDDETTMDHIEPLLHAVTLYNSQGRFAQSGRLLKSAAERFEERLDYDNAISFYKKAADSYELDNYGKVAFSQCLLKYADLISTHNENLYSEAIKIYESEGINNLKNQLLQYGVRDIFLKAGLLHMLAVDSTDARIAYNKYCNHDPKFSTSREGKFLIALIDAFDANDINEFQNKLVEFDAITRLDPWKVGVLYKIKKRFEDADDSDHNENEHVDLT